MEFNRTELEVVNNLMEKVEFNNFKVNYAVSRSHSKVKKELEAIKENIKEQKDVSKRFELNFVSTQENFEVDLYKLKKIPDDKDKELSIKQAFILQLLAESPVVFETDVTEETERDTFEMPIALLLPLTDLKMKREAALKIAWNILSFMNKSKEIQQEESYSSNIEVEYNRSKLIFSLYKKDENGELVLENNNPVFEDKKKAEEAIIAFDQEHKEATEEFNNWFRKEQIEMQYASICLEDLPEDTTKKQTDVLIKLIKE